MRSLGHMAEGYGVFEALKSGMSMDDTIARAMIAMGLPVGPNYMASDTANSIREIDIQHVDTLRRQTERYTGRGTAGDARPRTAYAGAKRRRFCLRS